VRNDKLDFLSDILDNLKAKTNMGKIMVEKDKLYHCYITKTRSYNEFEKRNEYVVLAWDDNFNFFITQSRIRPHGLHYGIGDIQYDLGNDDLRLGVMTTKPLECELPYLEIVVNKFLHTETIFLPYMDLFEEISKNRSNENTIAKNSNQILDTGDIDSSVQSTKNAQTDEEISYSPPCKSSKCFSKLEFDRFIHGTENELSIIEKINLSNSLENTKVDIDTTKRKRKKKKKFFKKSQSKKFLEVVRENELDDAEMVTAI
jgi:hypothetical protein